MTGNCSKCGEQGSHECKLSGETHKLPGETHKLTAGERIASMFVISDNSKKHLAIAIDAELSKRDQLLDSMAKTNRAMGKKLKELETKRWSPELQEKVLEVMCCIKRRVNRLNGNLGTEIRLSVGKCIAMIEAAETTDQEHECSLWLRIIMKTNLMQRNG